MRKILEAIKKNWLLVVILASLLALFYLLNYFYNRSHEDKFLGDVKAQLTTLAELKSLQVSSWRNERLVDGQAIQNDDEFSSKLSSLINDPNDFNNVMQIQYHLRTLLVDPNYAAIFFVDTSGGELIHVGSLDEAPLELQEVTAVEDQVLLTDLYLSSLNQKARLEMIVPIGTAEEPSLGQIIFLIDPYSILYPLLQNQPANYKTIETLMVRKENDSVLFLNETKFQTDSALKLTIPLSSDEVPAVMAVNGITGIVTGNDYRGAEVMASITQVENSNWKLLAKMDRSEINIPINQLHQSTTIASVILLLVAILSLYFAWRRRSESIYRGLNESETQRRRLQEEYTALFEQANDAIILVEETGKIIGANNRAVELYGYTKDEFASLTIADLRAESEKQKISSDMSSVKNGATTLFETMHRKKNGDLIQVDVSSRFLSIGGKNFFQSIVRDITERKQAEEKLMLSEEALKKAQQISHVGSWRWDRVKNEAEFSDEMFNIFGLDPKTWNGSVNDLIHFVLYPQDQEKIRQKFEKTIREKTLFSFETSIIRDDKAIRDLWIEAGEMEFGEDHSLLSISGIVQDITEKKAVERELRKNENLLQRIYDLLPVGLWITDKDGKMIRSNKMVKEIWGKDLLVDINDLGVFHGRRLPSREEIKPDDWASAHTIREGVTIRDEMVEIDAYDGKTKTVLNYSTPILGENDQLEGSIILNLDITELRKAEDQLKTQLDELRRWNLATLGRENRIRELKMEINDLCRKLGQPEKYPSVADESHD